MTGNEALLRAALQVWPFDEDPMRWDVEAGVVWALVKSPAVGINGYVLVPAEGHPWSTGFPQDNGDERCVDYALTVHGGVTYAQHPWIGFDTGHAYDVWDGEYDPLGLCRVGRGGSGQWDRRWTPILVAEEAKRLARQVAAIGAAPKELDCGQ